MSETRSQIAAVAEAIELLPDESLGDFKAELYNQLETWLRPWLPPRRWNRDLDEYVGYGWWIDDVLDASVVCRVYGSPTPGDDTWVSGFLQVDWSREGQVFTFSNPREVTRRTVYADLDDALKTLPVPSASAEESSPLAKAFNSALAGIRPE